VQGLRVTSVDVAEIAPAPPFMASEPLRKATAKSSDHGPKIEFQPQAKPTDSKEEPVAMKEEVPADEDALEPVEGKEKELAETKLLEQPKQHEAKPTATKLRTVSEHEATEARARVIEQIQEIVATRGTGKTTLRLNPSELGTLTVTVTSLGEGIEAKVTASNESVRQSLHSHRADLVQGVESRGLTMSGFTVGTEPQADTTHQGHGRQQQDMRQDFARSHNLWSARTDQPTTARPQYARLSHAGVDTLA
jgi:flagellar hook-length control protein FliK